MYPHFSYSLPFSACLSLSLSLSLSLTELFGQANFIAAWREHFVLTDNMLEVDCPSMTPEPVLKASGHVDRFTGAGEGSCVLYHDYHHHHLL